MLKITLGILALVLLAGAAALGVGALRDPAWSVSRTLFIEAPASRLHADVADLRAWSAWTPWSAREDATRVETASGPVAAPGQVVSWTADKQGAGQMTLTAVSAERVAYDAVIPQGVVHGEVALAPTTGGTLVTWTLRSEMPNPVGRAFVPLLQRFIGADLERGLTNLRSNHTSALAAK